MAVLLSIGMEPDGWADVLPEVQRVINNSESKTTTTTSFEMLHGYRPRFHQEALRELSTTVENCMPSEELRTAARTDVSIEKMKSSYDV